MPVPIPSFPKRILLIRLKGIGDVILSTPLLRALRKKFPTAEIHFLTRPVSGPILQKNPNLDRLILHPEKHESLRKKWEFIRSLRKSRYDWVLDLAAEPRSAWLTLATGAPLRAGFAFRVRKWAFTHPIPKNKVRKYQAEVNLDILRFLNVPDDGNRTELFIPEKDLQWAEELFARGEMAGLKWEIGLNPTGSWPSKRWSPDQWKELVLLIFGQLGVKPILFGGPGDKALIGEIRSGLEDKTLVKPETTLFQAAAFISKLDLLVGADGTPQHLAQALGTRSLTLCGPHWGISWVKPGDSRHRFLQHFLDCGPCDRNECPYPQEGNKAKHVQQECLRKITPSQVFQPLKEMLNLPV